MAARAWAVGILGLFLAWVVIEAVTGVIGTMFGLFQSFNSTGLVDPVWGRRITEIKNDFLGVWNYIPLIVLFSFIVYIVLESMRRRPEDYYI